MSVTEASGRGVARLAADAAHGTEVVVERHGEPVAAVVGVRALLPSSSSSRDDLRDLALVIGRRRGRRRPTHASTTWSTPSAVPRRRADVARVVLTIPRSTTCAAPARCSPPWCSDGSAVLDRDPTRGSPLVDEGTGYRVLVALDGDAARRLTRAHGDAVTVAAVWVDGARLDGEAYAEALERIQGRRPVGAGRRGSGRPRRLSRLTGSARPGDRLRAPVPDWLADALVAGRASTRSPSPPWTPRPPSTSWNARTDGSRSRRQKVATSHGGDQIAILPRAAGSADALAYLSVDGGAGLFELRLRLLGVFLGDLLEDGLGGAVDEVLGLLEAEARRRSPGPP